MGRVWEWDIRASYPTVSNPMWEGYGGVDELDIIPQQPVLAAGTVNPAASTPAHPRGEAAVVVAEIPPWRWPSSPRWSDMEVDVDSAFDPHRLSLDNLSRCLQRRSTPRTTRPCSRRSRTTRLWRGTTRSPPKTFSVGRAWIYRMRYWAWLLLLLVLSFGDCCCYWIFDSWERESWKQQRNGGKRTRCLVYSINCDKGILVLKKD